MFSQKRRKQNRILIFSIIIFTIMFASTAIIIAKNYAERKTEQYEANINTSAAVPYKDYSNEADDSGSDDADSDDAETAKTKDYDSEYDDETAEVNGQIIAEDGEWGSPYFVVKESNNIIKVFFHKNGHEKYLQDTDIIFDTLSEEDQKRFCEGITVSTEEELNKLIMDYES